MAAVTITISQRGPYKVQGDFELIDHEGKSIPFTPGKTISLCRCGGSVTKPFCDGTHSRIGFLAAEQATRDFDTRA